MTPDASPTVPVGHDSGSYRVTRTGPWPSTRPHAIPTPLKRRPGLYERKPWLPPDLTGQVLNNFRIVEQIGCGGMATVFRAEHIEIQKIVAIKVLRPRFARDPARAAQFRKEAQAVCNLRHEHLVEVWDYGHTPDNLAYYVLEYLDGQDLADTLIHEGPLPWPRVIAIAKQICLALQVAHDRDIIHRDIKPANCFRIHHNENPDFIKVLDFGIATTLLEAESGGGQRMGTPEYMAPELMDGHSYDNRVDIYSLGVLMHELLTGQLPDRPVPGSFDTRAKERRNRCAASMVQVLDDGIEVPAPLEMIILHAMAHDPDKRFRSATEFYDALEDAEQYLRTTGPVAVVEPDNLRATLPIQSASSSSHNMMELPAAASQSQIAIVPASSWRTQLGVVVATLFFVALAQFFHSRWSATKPVSTAPAEARVHTTKTAVTPPEAVIPKIVPPEPVEPELAQDSANAVDSSQELPQSADPEVAPAVSEEPEPPVPQITEELAPRTHLSKRQILRTVRKNRAALVKCVEQSGELVGHITAEIVVGPNGRVRSVQVPGAMTDLVFCCRDAVEKMRFPTSRDGGRHEVLILPPP